MSRTVGMGMVVALCASCLGLGGAGVYLWQDYRVREAQAEALRLRDANEALVAAKVRAETERDAAQRRTAEQRQVIYATDEHARAWGAAAVPESLSTRVRDSARGTDAAASGSRSGER